MVGKGQKPMIELPFLADADQVNNRLQIVVDHASGHPAKERKRLPVTSACIGAAVPVTTALRWLTVLEDKGLIVRENDAADARRVFVRLSTDGYEKMITYFSSVAGNMRQDEEIEPPALRMAN